VETLNQLVILAADDTVATATRLNLHDMIEVDLDELLKATRDEDFEKAFVHLDRIRRFSTTRMITSDVNMRRPFGILAGRTLEHIRAIVLNPDYRPPRAYP
jgi:hypothetical protein